MCAILAWHMGRNILCVGVAIVKYAHTALRWFCAQWRSHYAQNQQNQKGKMFILPKVLHLINWRTFKKRIL